MNYSELRNEKREVYPALLLDSALPKRLRKNVRRALLFSALALLALYFFLREYASLFRAALLILSSALVGMQLLEAMYRSFYFKKSRTDIRVLAVLDKVRGAEDLTAAFLRHEMGQYAMFRLGFAPAEIEEFARSKQDKVTLAEFQIVENDDSEVTFAEFGFSLLHFDSDLSALLRGRGILAADFKQVLEWTARLDRKSRQAERWWLRENLLRIPSLGKNLSFGQVYYLERFGHVILSDKSYVQLGEKWRLYQSSVNGIESALSKSVGANILLTARESYVSMDAIASLGKEILRGTVLPNVENKRIYVLDAVPFASAFDDRAQFETVLQTILSQAARAGNVILVIPDLPEFAQSAHALGSDVPQLLEDMLQSSDLHVIATASERAFHEVLETDFGLMSHFERIRLEELDEFQAVSMLQDEVLRAEGQYGVFFTYQALKAVVESADRYFGESSLSDKAVDILYEVVPAVLGQGKDVVRKEDVEALVSAKTGITLGRIGREEAEKLSSLKQEMHKRVIGQDRAIDDVCDAMLRARTGLADPKRPLASFLFVGPTGVGKTETAKALAALFFGDEENMLRSDMSEYADADALGRMIGSAQHPGLFASKVRERGHGVLLLDEFEKASPDVHDLFLQIVDEGFFTDGRGDRVNMRNFIIIATSNAGSELLYGANGQAAPGRQEVVDYIVSSRVLRAELLNRFDDIVLFEALGSDSLASVARLMVARLAARLEQRGIILRETPELVEYLSKTGRDSKFGAREMNRTVIRDIESRIAQALVLGDLFEGDTISFTVSDGRLEIQKYT